MKNGSYKRLPLVAAVLAAALPASCSQIPPSNPIASAAVEVSGTSSALYEAATRALADSSITTQAKAQSFDTLYARIEAQAKAGKVLVDGVQVPVNTQSLASIRKALGKLQAQYGTLGAMLEGEHIDLKQITAADIAAGMNSAKGSQGFGLDAAPSPPPALNGGGDLSKAQCDNIGSASEKLTYAGAAATFLCLIPGLNVIACGVAAALFTVAGVTLTGLQANKCGKSLNGTPITRENIGATQRETAPGASYGGNFPGGGKNVQWP